MLEYSINTKIPNREFLLKCPSCKKDMRYKENLNSPQKNSNLSSKKKRCVFCGTTFKILHSILKEL